MNRNLPRCSAEDALIPVVATLLTSPLVFNSAAEKRREITKIPYSSMFFTEDLRRPLSNISLVSLRTSITRRLSPKLPRRDMEKPNSSNTTGAGQAFSSSATSRESQMLAEHQRMYSETGPQFNMLRNRFCEAYMALSVARGIGPVSEVPQETVSANVHSAGSLTASSLPASSLTAEFTSTEDPSGDIKRTVSNLKDARRAMNKYMKGMETYMTNVADGKHSLSPYPLKVSPHVLKKMRERDMFLNPRPAPPIPAQAPSIPPGESLCVDRPHSELVQPQDLSIEKKDELDKTGAGNNSDLSEMKETTHDARQQHLKKLRESIKEAKRNKKESDGPNHQTSKAASGGI